MIKEFRVERLSLFLFLVLTLLMITGCGDKALIEEGGPLALEEVGTAEMSYLDYSNGEFQPDGANQYIYFISDTESDEPYAEVGRIAANQKKQVLFQSDEYWINAFLWDDSTKHFILGTKEGLEEKNDEQHCVLMCGENGAILSKNKVPDEVMAITKNGESYLIQMQSSEEADLMQLNQNGLLTNLNSYEKPFVFSQVVHGWEEIVLGYDLNREKEVAKPIAIYVTEEGSQKKIGIGESNELPMDAIRSGKKEFDCMLASVDTAAYLSAMLILKPKQSVKRFLQEKT